MGSISLISSLFDSSGRVQHACARLWARMVLVICWSPSQGFRCSPDSRRTFPAFSSQIIRVMSTSPLCLQPCPFPFGLRRRRNFSRFPSWDGIFDVLEMCRWIDIIRTQPSNSFVARAKSFDRERLSCFSRREQPAWMAALSPSRTGDCLLAEQSHADVVPVTIQGSRAVLMPRTYHVRGGPVTVTVGRPIPSVGHRAGELMAIVREEITTVFENGKALDRNTHSISR